MFGTDLIGCLLLVLLAALALVAGAVLMQYAHLTALNFLLGFFVCVAFVVVGLPVQVLHTPKNTLVHGAAKPASESEAHAAAHGQVKAAPMHDQTFKD
jgi:hypothetical protein